MQESSQEEKLEQNEAENTLPVKPRNIFNLSLHQPKPHILANPNRSIGKGMNATHQTKKPHKPKKKR